MKMNSCFLKLSLAINILALAGFLFLFLHYEFPRRITEYFFNVPHVNCINNTKIVVMGDSRTFVNWNRLMDRTDIVLVRGGEIPDLMEKIDFVRDLNPELCLVMVGINDMHWVKTPEEVFEEYKVLIDRMLEKNLKIVVQSVLYVCPVKLFYREQNREVDVLNAMLEKHCREKGILYLDLNSRLSENSHLIMAYSSDGVHISDSGYQVWKKELLPLFESMNL